MTSERKSLRSRVLTGTLWVVAMRWLIRSLGIVNVAIVARILSPGDFGLVAMAMIFVGLVEASLSFGLENACVQRPVLTREHLDAAWSMRILQGCAVGLLLLMLGPVAGLYFSEPRIVPVIVLLAFCLAVSSFGNIGVVQFRRDLDFLAEFRLQALSRLIAFVIGLIATFTLRNYWALVIGIASGYVTTVILSYVLHPFRPRWDLRRWRDLWGFSKGSFFLTLVSFLDQRTDEAIVGRVLPASQLGIYSVSSDLGQIPTTEVAGPLLRVAFPAFAEIQADSVRLRASYVRALETIASVAFPVGIGLATVATSAVVVLLGNAWTSASTVLAVIAAGSVLRACTTPATSLLMASGRPMLPAYMLLIGLVVLLLVGVPAALKFGVLGMAVAKGIAALVAFACGAFVVSRAIGLSILAQCRCLFRFLVASLVMAACVAAWPENLGLPLMATLIIKIAIGASTYAATLMAYWFIRGRPDGPESLATTLLRAKWTSLVSGAR